MPFPKKTYKGSVAATQRNPEPTKPTQQSTDLPLTSDEIATLKTLIARIRGRTDVRLTPCKEDPSNVATNFADPHIGNRLLMDAIGTSDPDFMNGLIAQLSRFNQKDPYYSRIPEFNFINLNFMLSCIKDLKPRDHLEARLAAQMATVHVAAMAAAANLMESEEVVEQESIGRSLNRLLRTYVSQMDCLKRFRARGPQMVQNVSVGEGGQAIVANVSQPLAGVTEVDASAPSTGEAPKTVTNVVPFDTKECISAPPPQRRKFKK
jgi:hypothetical protein